MYCCVEEETDLESFKVMTEETLSTVIPKAGARAMLMSLQVP